jgi:hypothetical protein
MVLEPSTLNRFPGFKKRVEWFLDNRPEVSARNMANMKGVLECTLFENVLTPLPTSQWQGRATIDGFGK